MPDPVTISNAPLDHPGMDYTFLRQEGIKLIEKLAGDRWTDYNAHDPGITILEALCYAITDLSYRLSFTVEELLAFPDSEKNGPPLFLTARDILTVNPLTLNDYRKLLLDIDIDGVRVFKNAWLEPIEAPQPAIFYDVNNAKLTFSNLDSFSLTEPVPLKGLYRVLLERKQGTSSKTELENAARIKLNQHRNLCEDFDEFKVLEPEEITVKAEIEIADHVDPNQLMAQLYAALDHAISPTIEFLSLSDMVNQDIPVEDIFVGPQLKHGFINDIQLEQFQRKTELRTSDLIHVVMDLPGVKTVRSITLTSGSQSPQAWALDLNPTLTPQLAPLANVLQEINLYKGQIPCPTNQAQVEAALKTSQLSAPQETSTSIQDISIPTGDYRELSEYESLQSEFPMVYGIGELGLPASSSPLRKAQTKQLQAYLMVFDQILANYFAQLDHVRELFALGNAEVKTYFTQRIAHFPGAQEILQDSDRYLEQLQESPTVARDRKHRLLDHLIAQYSETFIDDSLLYLNTESATATIQHKASFAKNYRQVSANRGQAINYLNNPNQSEKVSGLKQRIAQLLGIESDGRSLGSGENEGFYVIEHILLRPRQSDVSASGSQQNRDVLSFSKRITQFIQSATPGYVTCTSAKHGLQSGDTINVIYSGHYNGRYTAVNVQLDTFEIQANFSAAYTIEKDAWVKHTQQSDPFSFQVSIIAPSWLPPLLFWWKWYSKIYNEQPQDSKNFESWFFSLAYYVISERTRRFQHPNFKQLVQEIFIAETPAHITLYFHWLTQSRMIEFENYYNLLLQHLSGTASSTAESKAEAQAASTRLINFLGLGFTDIPEIPALIGYMVIGSTSGSDPQFVVANLS